MTTATAPTTGRTAPAGGPTVAEVMVTRPKVLPPDVPVREVRVAFADDHVVMVLLAEGGVLRGTLLREDLPATSAPDDPAHRLARTRGRTVTPTEPADAAHQRLLAAGERRLAVVDDGGRLLGLLCLKRRRDGFCSDAGVAARAAAARRVVPSANDTSRREELLCPTRR